jgi:AcrR family transcriptional regulator
MTEVRIDRRTARTRSLLHAGLAGLLKRKAYEAITVADICAEAGVGRSTFYAHFVDKDDLKRHALDHLGDALANARREARDRGERLPFAFCEAFFEHAVNHQAQLCVPARGQRAAVSLARVRQMLSAQVRAEFSAVDGDPSLRSARVAYVVAALIGLFEWWLGDGARRSPREMAALFRELAAPAQ